MKKSTVLKRASELNCTIHDTTDCLSVEAPKGSVMSSTGTHEVTVTYYSDKPWAWNEIFDEMSEGIEKCETENCEWCNEN